MAVGKTSLSAGYLIREILLEDPEVSQRTKRIFPVIADDATMPYILYRRIGFGQIAQKTADFADTLSIEVVCVTEGYTEGLELAEAIRNALDGVKATSNDGALRIRSCMLEDGEEGFEGDACIQQLVFSIKI